MAERRTPFSFKLSTSLTIVFTNRSINASISSLGRFQFSVLKAYRVR